MRTLHLLVPLLSLLAACGRSLPIADEARVVLDGPERLEILALHPAPYEPEGAPTGEADDFHGYRILGRAEVPSAVDRREVIELVYEGIAASDGTVAACFNPRHGIRATRGTEVVDLVICFECLSMGIHGPVGERESAATSRHVEPRVTRFFEDRGLAIHGD